MHEHESPLRGTHKGQTVFQLIWYFREKWVLENKNTGKQKTLENKKLACHQARTRKRGLQARLPPLRSHLAKTASQNEGTQAQYKKSPTCKKSQLLFTNTPVKNLKFLFINTCRSQKLGKTVDGKNCQKSVLKTTADTIPEKTFLAEKFCQKYLLWILSLFTAL